MSVLEIIPKTCKATDNPPSPSKNEHIITFVDIYLEEIIETSFTPFVSSIIPQKNAEINCVSILNKLHIG